jgi:hypothetical protein
MTPIELFIEWKTASENGFNTNNLLYEEGASMMAEHIGKFAEWRDVGYFQVRCYDYDSDSIVKKWMSLSSPHDDKSYFTTEQLVNLYFEQLNK